MKLNITAFGLASAIILSLSILLYSALAATVGYGIEIETYLESFLPGYTLTIAGVIVGVIWCFAIGYLTAALFAWIHNKLCK